MSENFDSAIEVGFCGAVAMEADSVEVFSTVCGTISGQPFLYELSTMALLERAVRSARPRNSRGWQPRWVAVKDCFALGSTYSKDLCRKFRLDPDELVRRGG